MHASSRTAPVQREGRGLSLSRSPARAAPCTWAQRASSLVAFRILFRRPSAPGRGYTRLRSRRLVAASLPSPSPSPSSLLSPSSLPLPSPSPSACEGATYLPRLSLLPSPRFPPPSSFPRVSIPYASSINLSSLLGSIYIARPSHATRENPIRPHARTSCPSRSEIFERRRFSSVVSTLRKWASSSPPAGEETEDNSSSSSSRSTTASG